MEFCAITNFKFAHKLFLTFNEIIRVDLLKLIKSEISSLSFRPYINDHDCMLATYPRIVESVNPVACYKKEEHLPNKLYDIIQKKLKDMVKNLCQRLTSGHFGLGQFGTNENTLKIPATLS